MSALSWLLVSFPSPLDVVLVPVLHCALSIRRAFSGGPRSLFDTACTTVALSGRRWRYGVGVGTPRVLLRRMLFGFVFFLMCDVDVKRCRVRRGGMVLLVCILR